MGCVLELTDACDGCCGAIGEGCSNCLGGLGRDESENFQNGKQIFGFWSYYSRFGIRSDFAHFLVFRPQIGLKHLVCGFQMEACIVPMSKLTF